METDLEPNVTGREEWPELQVTAAPVQDAKTATARAFYTLLRLNLEDVRRALESKKLIPGLRKLGSVNAHVLLMKDPLCLAVLIESYASDVVWIRPEQFDLSRPEQMRAFQKILQLLEILSTSPLGRNAPADHRSKNKWLGVERVVLRRNESVADQEAWGELLRIWRDVVKDAHGV
jgi:hypothetical protein